MRRMGVASRTLCIALSTSVLALAADLPSPVRQFCDPTDAGNKCPGQACVCTEDTLSVEFPQAGGPILETGELVPGSAIEAEIVVDATSEPIQGWSYSVKHDPAFLSLESVNQVVTALRSGKKLEGVLARETLKSLEEAWNRDIKTRIIPELKGEGKAKTTEK